MKNNLLNSLVAAPVALFGMMATTTITAQAADFVNDSGTATLNGVVNFRSGTPGTSNPAEFWFAQETTCSAAGTGCDFSIATVTGLFTEAINLPGDALSGGYQYLLPQRNDLTPNAGGILPSLSLDSNAFLPDFDLDPNTIGPDMIATGTSVAAAPDQFLAFVMESADPNGLPFLRFDAGDTKPDIDIFLTQIDKFNSSFDSLGQTGDTNIFGLIRAEATFDDGTVVDLFGGSNASASFSFSDTQSALNISVNLEHDQDIPESSSIIGLTVVAGAGALYLKKKKPKKIELSI